MKKIASFLTISFLTFVAIDQIFYVLCKEYGWSFLDIANLYLSIPIALVIGYFAAKSNYGRQWTGIALLAAMLCWARGEGTFSKEMQKRAKEHPYISEKTKQ